MKKLTLSDWAHIAEIITSIVIIISLIYVVIELNHNTRAMQNESHLALVTQLTDGDLQLAANEDLHKIVDTARFSPEKSTPNEWSRFTIYAYTRIGIWEYNFFARENDAVSEVQWNSFEPYFHSTICEPGYRKWWPDNQKNFAPEFRTYIDKTVLPTCPTTE